MDQQKRTIFLVHNTARENAARMCHQAPGDWVAVFKPKTRSLEQNAKLHAMLTDISDQAIYMGKKRSVEFWKGLFVSGYQIATGKEPRDCAGAGRGVHQHPPEHCEHGHSDGCRVDRVHIRMGRDE
mgnify:CR=1 FL=1